MSSIMGPYAGVESDYRRQRITESFREHRSRGRRLFLRRAPKGAVEPAINWFGE